MFELFKTVLILSIIGSVITAVLLLLKPLTSRKFPSHWQYYIWLLSLLFMLLPVWKILPQRPLQPAQPASYTAAPAEEAAPSPSARPQSGADTAVISEIPVQYRSVTIAFASVRIYDIIAYVWFAGMTVFILSAAASYLLFLAKKRRQSHELSECEVFDEVKKELGIKRRIRLRVYPGGDSPMLTGILRPVIYLPVSTLSKEQLSMVFRHELTHLKRGDLIYKWFTLFVNAVHWFNPFAYLLSANVNEACEVSCDMAVTKNMNKEEISLYMKTILHLAERRKEEK